MTFLFYFQPFLMDGHFITQNERSIKNYEKDIQTIMQNVYQTKEEMINCVNAFYDGMVARSEEIKQHPNYKTGENYVNLGTVCSLVQM